MDHFRDRILFVQVGEKGHYHPPLKGVLDMRGKTTLRDLIRLMYHADGVVCPVTLHMHLAAAVPLPPGRKRLRSCVVGVRAEPFAPGADEWLALEVHMMQRAAGMPLEGVSVRP